MKFFTTAAVLMFVSQAAFAVPTQNRLIQPDKVRIKGQEIEVTYTLPCQADDTFTFVLNYDDTGDRCVAVGVVTSRAPRNCHPHAPQKFKRSFNPAEYSAPSVKDSNCFVPMEVE